MPVKRPAPGDLEPIETASRDEIAALQLTRLRATLAHAYENVPHYRRAFDAKGVHPSDLKHLSDLSKFPFTVKSDLRDNYPFGLLAVPREQLARIHASSGTTGKPTVVGYTQGDIDRWADLVARSIRAAGGRAGDLVHVSYGYGLFTGGLGAHYGAERLGCTVIPMSGGQTEKQVQLIRDLQPSIIMVTPSYMQVIVEEFARQGLDARESSLKVGIFGAEPWTEAMRREIEANLEREVSQRVKMKAKEQVMQALLDSTEILAPRALVEMETERLMQDARKDLASRGMSAKNMALPPDLFRERAQRRVSLGLILGELVKAHGLHPKAEQVRAVVEDLSQSYENPAEVVKWHYAEPDRL
ncbi:MAG: AMP-binding protein, partial [Variovorax sp.]|nr:AMP-binding protein [Variovorax sp.]